MFDVVDWLVFRLVWLWLINIVFACRQTHTRTFIPLSIDNVLSTFWCQPSDSTGTRIESPQSGYQSKAHSAWTYLGRTKDSGEQRLHTHTRFNDELYTTIPNGQTFGNVLIARGPHASMHRRDRFVVVLVRCGWTYTNWQRGACAHSTNTCKRMHSWKARFELERLASIRRVLARQKHTKQCEREVAQSTTITSSSSGDASLH